MCDPMTILGLVGGLASSLFGLGASSPPPAAMPAAPAPTARTPGATVRVGTGADELDNNDPTTSSTARPVQQRTAGTALGGLGRSTLAL